MRARTASHAAVPSLLRSKPRGLPRGSRQARSSKRARLRCDQRLESTLLGSSERGRERSLRFSISSRKAARDRERERRRRGKVHEETGGWGARGERAARWLTWSSSRASPPGEKAAEAEGEEEEEAMLQGSLSLAQTHLFIPWSKGEASKSPVPHGLRATSLEEVLQARCRVTSARARAALSPQGPPTG